MSKTPKFCVRSDVRMSGVLKDPRTRTDSPTCPKRTRTDKRTLPDIPDISSRRSECPRVGRDSFATVGAICGTGRASIPRQMLAEHTHGICKALLGKDCCAVSKFDVFAVSSREPESRRTVMEVC